MKNTLKNNRNYTPKYTFYIIGESKNSKKKRKDEMTKREVMETTNHTLSHVFLSPN
jgi:peptidoglycan/xylan/chitin deacetylase (PgdA/CDA1 family)